jgi:hypothetical protein
MKEGQVVILTPGVSNLKKSGSDAHRYRVTNILKAVTEEVTIINPLTAGGNAKVMDSRGVKFLCNPLDLKEKEVEPV